MPSWRMLAADLFRTQAYTSHKGKGTRPSWNLVFADGHAVTVVSPELWAAMQTLGEYSNKSSSWPIVEDERDILETQAQGRPISDNPKGIGDATETGCRVSHVPGEGTAGTGTMEGRQPTP